MCKMVRRRSCSQVCVMVTMVIEHFDQQICMLKTECYSLKPYIIRFIFTRDLQHGLWKTLIAIHDDGLSLDVLMLSL